MFLAAISSSDEFAGNFQHVFFFSMYVPPIYLPVYVYQMS